MTKKLVKPADFATAVLTLRGKPLSFNGYEPFRAIYNHYPKTMVLKAGRQVGKSVSLAGSLITNSILNSNFNSLFISPLAQQTSRFSTSYLDPYMNGALVQKHFINKSSRKNVLLKEFNNDSKIFLGYASDEADSSRIRGVNADQVLCDELQDISTDALPVLFECLGASDWGYRRLTGTSKGENNTLEIYWARSNKMEWAWKCPHCSKYIVPYDFETCMKIIQGKTGPACPHCGGIATNVEEGKWISFAPQNANALGFHLPQIIFGSRVAKWEDVRSKLNDYTPTKIANEVFGIASGVGGRILTLRECMACCNPELTGFESNRPSNRGICNTILGVDWSCTGSTKSYTVVSILGFDFNGKVILLHSEKMMGNDILEQVARIKILFRQFDCQAICSDCGMGIVQIEILTQEFGADRVFGVRYVSAKRPLRYDQEGRFFAADRTMAIDGMVMKLKMGRERFESPAWSVMGPFYEDALAMYEEESLSGRKLYRKDEDKTDDWMHSIVFASIGFQIISGNYTYLDDMP